jgi:hypothetical protein
MSQYMLLLYTTEEEEHADRGAEMPMWLELNRSLEEAGLLAATGRLHPTTAATNRQRDLRRDGAYGRSVRDHQGGARGLLPDRG